MKRQSHQRITKIKRDKIEELLKQAESISVEDGTVVQPQGADLIPYPDMDRLRLWTNSYLLPGVNKIYPTKIDDKGTMYLTAIVDGLPLHTKMTKSIEVTTTDSSGKTTTVTSETSKPGLWLSNFIYPVYGDGNGSYLEHNKVHSNEHAFDKFNSDIIGNYSYSFIQRGKITKYSEANWDKGCDTTFWGNIPNNYNIHYIPNIHSCMAYPALKIANPKFGQNYTTYQTIVTPSDPDMQNYQETYHKCITFNNREYSNSESVTKYAARLVGKDWRYELTFNGNGNGSGNNYGTGGNPDADNGSNGGCVTGTIIYADSNLGTTCTQEINSCFQTYQSFFNPDAPHNNDNQVLDDEDIEVITRKFNLVGCCSNVANDFEPFAPGEYLASFSATVNCGSYSNSTPGSAFCSWDYHRCGVGGEHRRFIFRGATEGWNVGWDINGCIGGTWCGDYYGHGTFRLTKPSNIKEQTNVNIYMNIYDLKAEAEDQGLPWTGGCGEARFTVEFSTSKCDKPGCTSRVIASNVDINSIGDISKLNNIVITG